MSVEAGARRWKNGSAYERRLLAPNRHPDILSASSISEPRFSGEFRRLAKRGLGDFSSRMFDLSVLKSTSETWCRAEGSGALISICISQDDYPTGTSPTCLSGSRGRRTGILMWTSAVGRGPAIKSRTLCNWRSARSRNLGNYSGRFRGKITQRRFRLWCIVDLTNRDPQRGLGLRQAPG